MPVEAQTVEYVYLGDGVSTAFSFPSKFLSSSDMVVALDGQEQTGGFYVTGAGAEAGGTVTFSAAPSAGVRVSLLRKPAASQLLDFVNGQTVLEGLLDTGLDKLTMLIQYLLRGIQKSVRLSEFDSASLSPVGFADERANKLLAFDSNGELALAATQGDATLVLASRAEAEAGENNSNVMTPLRVSQAIAVATVDPVAFGAVADGVTNDTTAFTALELLYSGVVINLRGRTYVVTSIPVGNTYVNGSFVVSGTTYQAAQDAAVLSSLKDTMGVGAAYTSGLYNTPTTPGRSTDHLYALLASQNSRARGPARAVNVASIYCDAHGNVSANLAARQCNAWVPQSVNIASEECSVWGGFRGANIAAFHSKCEHESNANIAARESSAASRNGVNIASFGAYTGRGGGWRGVVTCSGGAVTAVTTAVDGGVPQTGRGFQVGDPIVVLDRMSGANNAVVTVASVDANGGILTTTVAFGGSNYGTTPAPDGNYYVDAYVDNGTGDFSANLACPGYTETTGTGAANVASSGASGAFCTASGVTSANVASKSSVASALNSSNLAGENNVASGTQSATIAASGCVAQGVASLATGVINAVSADRAVVFGRRTLNNQVSSIALGDGGSGSASSANRKFHAFANGNVQASGVFTGSTTFTDYAEMFENAAYGVIPLGTIVALDGRKVRPAVGGDDILGVVSGTALVVAGDSPFTWAGRYLTGEFGEPLWADIPMVRWTATETRSAFDGTEAEALRLFGKFPEDAAHSVQRCRVENPDFNVETENTPRSERPDEWTIVGLLGQVHVRVGEDVVPGDYVGPDGHKCHTVTRLRCMEIRRAYDPGKQYAVAFCLLV